MVALIIGLVVGACLGIIVTGLLAGSAYRRGREDQAEADRWMMKMRDGSHDSSR